MVDFHQVLTDYDLRDLGFNGNPFTWSNRREAEALICEHLDRWCANSAWCTLYMNSKVVHISVAYLDHLLVWLHLSSEAPLLRDPKPFRFKMMWIGEWGCIEIITSMWNDRVLRGQKQHVMELVRHCGLQLSRWNKSSFGNVQNWCKWPKLN